MLTSSTILTRTLGVHTLNDAPLLMITMYCPPSSINLGSSSCTEPAQAGGRATNWNDLVGSAGPSWATPICPFFRNEETEA